MLRMNGICSAEESWPRLGSCVAILPAYWDVPEFHNFQVWGDRGCVFEFLKLCVSEFAI